ncbi:type II toxin-antitoxin system RelE/ParE family toxin [Mesorhizobium opportunistum]|uniref:type II toxin-antitoxin system RelE/ParE family toxin n=2 Tax=Mesorhizobium opportunistum TaxID=593909 RepID=UPI003338E246
MPRISAIEKYCKKGILGGMSWSVAFLNIEVRRELEAQPKDILASFLRISRLIEAHGLQKVHEPYVKHLEGKLWEMRMKGRDGIGRAVYVTAAERRVIVVRVFAKKTQKTPRSEIELALKRAKEVL